MDAGWKPLVQAIENRTGKRVGLSVAMRWAQKGCGGVRLKSRVYGNRRYTTEAAVDEFWKARKSIDEERNKNAW